MRSNFLAGQYELLYSLNDREKRFRLLLGMALLSYWTKFQLQPTIPNSFYSHDRYIGSRINVTPHATFRLTKKLLVDINLKLGAYEIRQYQQFIKNPAIPENLQRENKIQHKFFPIAHTLRLGLEYRL